MEEGDLVLCTVERIESTSVFVKLPDSREATLIISEIAPGRIKNLREYVMPNKKIVCKIMRISGDRIDVSLRRVTSKEKQDVMEKFKQEQQFKSGFNQILKEKAKEVEAKIISGYKTLSYFVDKARENPRLIEDYFPKEFHEQIKKVIQKKQKEVEAKKIIKIKCLANDGIIRIKKILEVTDPKMKITYIAAGTFQIEVKSENYKDANHKLEQFIQNIEKQAKSNQCEFSVEEK